MVNKSFLKLGKVFPSVIIDVVRAVEYFKALRASDKKRKCELRGHCGLL